MQKGVSFLLFSASAENNSLISTENFHKKDFLGEVLIQLFQKLARVWGAQPHETAFLFVSFFFAPCTVKEKATKDFSAFPLQRQAPSASAENNSLISTEKLGTDQCIFLSWCFCNKSIQNATHGAHSPTVTSDTSMRHASSFAKTPHASSYKKLVTA